MNRVICYIRKSTASQSYDSQEQELTRYIKVRGWEEHTEYIHDTISGAKANREGLNKLMAKVRKGRIKTLVVYKIDRLGRSLPHFCQIIEELRKHGVSLIAPSQGIDTSTDNPTSQLQINILMSVAQFERSLIAERVRAGKAASSKKQGRKNRSEQHKAKAIELRQAGLSEAKIGNELGLSQSTVHRLLRAD